MKVFCRAARYFGSFVSRVKNYRSGLLTASNVISRDFNRVYFYHIRKTGGTSLNHMFLAFSGRDSHKIYHKLADVSKNHRIIANGKVFVGWNRQLIEQGYFFYAFSHLPYHILALPERTFTVTCLRDPVRRVLSHYKMLLIYRQSGSFRADYEEESTWLGSGFSEFIDRIPCEHLLRQLYMFSRGFEVDEAFDNILNLSHYFFTENFAEGVKDLSVKTGLPLTPIHIRKTDFQFQPTKADLEKLRERVQPELELYQRLRQAYQSFKSRNDP